MIEIFHSMSEYDRKVCPQCKRKGLEKLISSGGGVIVAGREANQYNDIKKAKYWRDKNGIKHKVGSGDGHTGSGTITKQTATLEQVKANRKREMITDRRKRSRGSHGKK